eukprot:COSAG01_NODE_70886_length_257_cov_0.981013_1_plen_20_part_01
MEREEQKLKMVAMVMTMLMV